MTLYQKLQEEFLNHRNFWNYYDEYFDNIFMNEHNARKFINNFFKAGSKTYVLDSWKGTTNEYMKMRNVHTVNVFFIGAYLQRIIDENIMIESDISSYYSFSYIWYLACLAHDFGYKYENYSKIYLGIPNTRRFPIYYDRKRQNNNWLSRKRWYYEHGIDIVYLHPSFDKRKFVPYNIEKTINNNIKYNNGTIISKPRYSFNVKEGYFYYRLYEMGKLDHGIIGADEFYSRMYVNYIREYMSVAKTKLDSVNFHNFHNKRGLHFCSEQFKIFAYISDCIASHNIFKADEKTMCTYKNYSLDYLLPDKYNLISYQDNPLLFILCVADTIEPSKRFNNYTNKDILNLISIEFDRDANLLTVEIDEIIYNSEAGHKYVSDIEELSKWCDVNTRVSIKRLH